VVRHHQQEVEYVETSDEGILLDIDHPQDYQALQARWEVLSRTRGEPSGERS
jgi:hypothetical protein